MTTAFVASRGGHLSEMLALAPRLPDDHTVWVTNDSPQSRGLLEGREVVYVPYSGSRRIDVVLRNATRARSILQEHRVDRIVSTGASIAISFMPSAVRRGIECHYIESATRVTGPSLTGRILSRVPGVIRYSQNGDWANGWHHIGSVFDGYEPLTPAPRAVRRVVVTLGTWRQSFRSVVERLIEVLPSGVETLWQTGQTDTSGLGIDSRRWVPPEELRRALLDADVVVSHCGVGAALDALDAGKCAVLVPRRATHGEQVDDHQEQLAAALVARGLALSTTPDEISFPMLQAAADRGVQRVASLPPLELVHKGLELPK